MLRIEKKAPDGASDEQWRAFLRSTGVRIKNDDDSKPWGPLARRDFLNWLENEHPDRMPEFFESREAAQIELNNRRELSKIEEEDQVKGDRNEPL